jgi:ATP phosphoribosyltransferase
MDKLKILLPKGRLFENVIQLFYDAGYQIQVSDRSYRPEIECDWIDLKIMKHQNIGDLLGGGSHDAGFTGIDWIKENKSDVEEILDLGFDRMKIEVVSKCQPDMLKNKDLIIATDYNNLSQAWLSKSSYTCKKIIRTYGSPDVLDDDVDIIIDHTTPDQILKNKFYIIDTIMESTTRFFASKEAMKDKNKREKIKKLKILFEAVLDGRKYVMLEMNVAKEHFDNVISFVKNECMRSPTIASLHNDAGYAIKIAIPKNDVPWVLHELTEQGATDILEFSLNKVVR